MARPEYDAVLIHALGDNRSRLHIRQRLTIRSAVELDKEVGVGIFVISGPPFQGSQPVALMVKEELINKYKIPKARIIINTDRPMTTSAELGFFTEQIGEHPEWMNVAHISMKSHALSMLALSRLFKNIRKGLKVDFITAEETLKSKHYKKFFTKLHMTKDEGIWNLYELIKFPFLLFPPTERLLNKIATHWRPQVTRN